MVFLLQNSLRQFLFPWLYLVLLIFKRLVLIKSISLDVELLYFSHPLFSGLQISGAVFFQFFQQPPTIPRLNTESINRILLECSAHKSHFAVCTLIIIHPSHCGSLCVNTTGDPSTECLFPGEPPNDSFSTILLIPLFNPSVKFTFSFLGTLRMQLQILLVWARLSVRETRGSTVRLDPNW